MKRFWNWLIHPAVASAIAVLILSALVWWVAPLLGLTSGMWRVVVIAALCPCGPGLLWPQAQAPGCRCSRARNAADRLHTATAVPCRSSLARADVVPARIAVKLA